MHYAAGSSLSDSSFPHCICAAAMPWDFKSEISNIIFKI